MDSVTLFPRGAGQQAPSKGAKRPLRNEDLFGASKRAKTIEVAKKSSKTSKQSSIGKPTLGLGLTLQQNSKQHAKIDGLNSKKLTPGCLVLGIVLSFQKDGALISLPGGSVGKILLRDLTEPSLEITDASIVFVERQVIRCVVSSSDPDSKFVSLSSRCSQVNRGLAFKHLQKGMSLCVNVMSKEDHGYILSAGINGAHFFLPARDAVAKFGDAELRPGKLLHGIVHDINTDSKLVSVRLDISREDSVKSSHFPFLAVAPGMIFDVVVDKVVENGLLVSYLSLFHGMIDLYSMSKLPAAEWATAYKEGTVLQARVVFVDHVNKVVRLSMRPHVLLFEAPKEFPPLGSMVASLAVRCVVKRTSLILTAPENGETEAAGEDEAKEKTDKKKSAKKRKMDELQKAQPIAYIITKSNLAQKAVEGESDNDFFSRYAVGEEVENVRVKGYHLVEGFVSVSNLSTFVQGAIVHFSDVKPGQKHVVTVKTVLDSGLAVVIGGSVDAFCPLLHTSDLVVEGKLKKKFKAGQKLTMKVWETKNGSILMTNKKSLVEMDGNELLEPAHVVAGKTTVGVVQTTNNDGVVVRFFNRLRGVMSVHTLTRQAVLDPAESFREGQVVKVVVLQAPCKENKSKAQLALDISADAATLMELMRSLTTTTAASASSNLFIGGTVFKVENENISIRLTDGRSATAGKEQLFDFAETAKQLADVFKPGFSIDRLWAMGNSSSLTVTAKPLLLHALEKMENASADNAGAEEISFPKDIAELAPGQIVAGFISKVESYGVIVKFQGNLTALAPRPNISDKFVSSPVGLFNVGDSVRCMVQRVDLTKGRVFVTFKPSLVPPSSGDHSFLLAHLREAFKVAEARSRQEQKLLPSWGSYPFGTAVTATVTSIESYGVILTGADQATIMLDKSVGEDAATMKVGDEVSALVLDVDFDHHVLQVRITGRAQTKKKAKKDKPAKVTSGDVLDMTVQLVKDKYAVVADLQKQLVGYVMLADYHYPQGANAEVVEGQTLSVVVDRPAGKMSPAAFPHENAMLLRMSSDAFQGGDAANKALRNAEQKEGTERQLESIKVGTRCKWVVKSISETEVVLASESAAPMRGCIDLSNALDKFALFDRLQEQLESVLDGSLREGLHPRHPFAALKVGASVRCQVLQIREGDESEAATAHVRPCTKDSSASEEQKKRFHFMLQCWGRDAVRCPSLATAVVASFDAFGCTLALSPYVHATMPFVDVSSDPKVVDLFKKKCFVGLHLVVAVTSVVKSGGKVKVHVSRAIVESLLVGDADITSVGEKDLQQAIDGFRAVQVGDLIVGEVDLHCRHAVNGPAVMIALPGDRQGRVCATELTDTDKWADLAGLLDGTADALPSGIQHGALVTVRVLAKDGKCADLSLRPSRLEQKAKAKSAVKADSVPKVGDAVQGYIVHVGPKGCFVRLSCKTTGRVLLKDLSDAFVERPESLFRTGQLVKARVRCVENEQVQLSLRASEVLGKAQMAEALQNIQEGDVLQGVVQRVLDIGVFVEIKGTGVVGLARKEQALQNLRKALQEEYSVGDLVRAKVLRVSRESGKVALGLTAEFFKASQPVQAVDCRAAADAETLSSDDEEEAEEEAEEEPASSAQRKRAHDDKADKAPKKMRVLVDDEDDDLAPLQWGNENAAADAQDADSDSADSDDEDAAAKGKLRGKQRDVLRKKDEQLLREKERALADGSAAPQRPEDFERLLLAEPNSSFLWIQYVAHYVKSADVEAARLLAQRALKAIHFRELKEKFNVWMAWLNLEYKFGSKQSLEQTLKQAEAESKGKDVLLAMAKVYEEAADLQSAENLLTKALGKTTYKKSKKVWMALQRLQLKAGRADAARASLDRSLLSLGKHKHVETVARFAMACFDFSSAERARQLLDDLLEHYPKRSDLWHLYVDKETKLGHVQHARQLYERMVALKSSARNMKTVFKKYLALEVRFGDEASQQAVKEKAAAYLASLA